jgi:plastocyanin
MTMPLPFQKFSGVASGLILCCLHFAPAGLAATANVTVGSPLNKFSPAVVNIATGDQVVWTWAGTFHSTTSGTNGVAGDDNGVPSGLWDSGVITSLPKTFTNTFNSAGTFAYYCQIHFATPNFMTGAVIVASANLPPSVTLTNPASGFVFSAPATINLAASAADTDGSVTNVRFLQGTTVLTNRTASPYSIAVSNLAAGTYIFTAVAADNGGLTATNAITNSVVNPVTVSLSGAVRLAPANFYFAYTANAGLRYIVQRSTNLSPASWSTLVTNLAGGSSVNFTDLNATVNPGFYRVGRLPNP